MTKILQENEVTLQTLANCIEDAGIDVELVVGQRLIVHTPKGLGFSISIDDRKFINLSTNLPIRKGYEYSLDLANRLNWEVFLCCFSIDRDNDLHVNYSMSYEKGLIVAQFMRVFKRFSGVLEHVVDNFNEHGDVFAFSNENDEAVTEAAPTIQ